MRPPLLNRRTFHIALPIVFVACANVDRVDYSVEVRRVGKTKVKDFSYTYGSLGRRQSPRLGLGGDSVTMPMVIPEVVNIEWTTESDNIRRAADIPLRSRLSKMALSGRIVRFDIDGDTLMVYLITRLPAFQEHSQLIFRIRDGVVEN